MKHSIITFAVVISLFANFIISAQEVVVSEYRDRQGTPAGEWTELLVIDDNVTLVGYAIRDNSGSSGTPDNWQGGVEFKDHSLWKNLRRGTIIVIEHRGTSTPDNTRGDGYIHVHAENSTYFEKQMYCSGCTVQDDWSNSALNIAEASDIIQIINPSGSHVHCLAHMDASAGDFDVLPNGRKISHGSGNVNNGNSVKVVPGSKLSDYNVGFDNSNNYTAASAQISQGHPNQETSSDNRNQVYWRMLRQPDWNNPQINTATLGATDVLLRWNKAEDAVPGDMTQGYLVVRFLSSEAAGVNDPVDGRSYMRGDELGTATVVQSLRENQYVDEYELPCGKKFTYRIYAYRYMDDDRNDDNDPKDGRGRSYNEDDFAETEVEKVQPEDPTIESEDGKTVICEDENLELRCIADPADGPYQYRWEKSGVMVVDYSEGKETLLVNQSGKYRVTIKTAYGCEAYEEIDITVLDKPDAKLTYEDYTEIYKDETVIICEGEDLMLRSIGGDGRQWYKDGNPIPGENLPEFYPTEEGVYHVVVTNQGMCPVESPEVTVEFIVVDFTANPSVMTFNLGQSDVFQDQDVTITNNGPDDLTFDAVDINLPPEFQITNPASPPYLVPAGGNLTITIRFTPTQPGNTGGKFVLNGPCDESVEIDLQGFKPSTSVSAEWNKYEFGFVLSCDTAPRDTVITLNNPGSKDVDLLQPVVAAPFTVITPATWPAQLAQSGTLDLTVNFQSATDGIYEDTLKIPYDNGTDVDTVRVYLQAEVVTPAFSMEYPSLDVTLFDCDTYKDTTLAITNEGKVGIVLNTQPANPAIQFRNLPVNIAAGESENLSVRFEPQSDSDLGVPINVDIISEPCAITKQLTVQGTKKGMILSFDRTTVDFDTLARCDATADDAIETINLSVTGDSQDDPVVTDIQITGSIASYLDIDLTLGQTIDVENLPIDISFPGTAPDGDYKGEITITFDPCAVEKVINVKAARFAPSYTVDKTDIDFGTSLAPVIASRSIVISNTGRIAITINGFDQIAPPFYLDASNPAFPFEIPAGENQEIFIEYRQNVRSDDELDVRLDVPLPCPMGTALKLHGEATEEGGGDISFSVPIINAAPGDIEQITFRVVAAPPFVIGEGEIRDFRVELDYDETMIEPLSVEAGAGLPEGSVQNLAMTIDDPGLAVLSFESVDPTLIKDGTFFNIRTRVLLADKLSSDLLIDDYTISSDFAINVVDIQNGRVNLDDVCILEQRLMQVGGSSMLYLAGSNPVGNKAELVFETITDDRSVIKIYDALGQCIATPADGFYSKGKNTVKLNMSGFPGGVYHAVLSNGNIIRKLRFVVVK